MTDAAEKSDDDIVQAYVRYQTGVGGMGDDSDWWAVEELNELAIRDPNRAWKLIQVINTAPISDENWRPTLHSTVGCGPLEDIIALHGEPLLSQILTTARTDEIVRKQLSMIYESSLKPDTWQKIQTILKQVT